MMCEEKSRTELEVQQEDIFREETAVIAEQEEILAETETETLRNDPAPEEPATETSSTEENSEEPLAEEAAGEESAEEPAEEESAEEPAEEEPAAEETAEEETSEDVEIPLPDVRPYHERYYLRYREGRRNTALDLEGTRGLLLELGFDGGELRQAREGKNSAEAFQNAGTDKNSQMRCSYCGMQLSGVEFYRVAGKRMRCTNCSTTVVESKAEVEALLQRVISNMENFFGATIGVPVSIEITTERKLKGKIGVPLGTRDGQSVLILGVAINDKKKRKYSIVLENGAPRISLMATFAHELTHIWQYVNWDNRKGFRTCPDNKRLLVYEGMAKWAEIQYLYLIGETNVARREEFITRNRKDEYGIGFCLYEEYFPLAREAMSCQETPFTPGRYPFAE